VKSRQLLVAMGMFVAGVFCYAIFAPEPGHGPTGAADPAASGDGGATPLPSASSDEAYDVTPLIQPHGKYLGIALSGAPRDMSRVDAFAGRISGRPNMITIYESFDDAFAAAEVRKIHGYGALPIVRWEPYRHGLAELAAGRHDTYLSTFAADVRRVNLPIALTVAHEMNGHWYPWGAHQNKASDFVAAWRHIHDVFAAAGATNVIWTWTPNVVNHLPNVPLSPLYPGDEYVDWIGLDGYFRQASGETFEGLFGPTITDVQRFTRKPFLIVETGVEPGSIRAHAVTDLFTSIAARPDVVGFVYFNQRGSGNWVLDTDAPALAVFHSHPQRSQFGFPVR
jgi:mannan endo-1,4-beta-mannosidase